MMFSGNYKGRRVLVTGHTGFVGGWLCLWLKSLGAKVGGYSLDAPTKPSFFETINLKSEIDEHVIGDIRDVEKLRAFFERFKPEVVFHLAAQPFVRLSYREPRETYETNVMGTINVLESVRYTESVRSCVVITSDKCYENKEWVFGYREIDPMGGYDPYSSSKGCAELVTNAYRRSFFNPEEFSKSHSVAISTVRAGNIIGGGDWGQDRLIPDCFRFLSNNETIYLRNPNAIRPWQIVLEPVSGYLWLGALMLQEGKRYSESWNLGPLENSFMTVKEVVNCFVKEWGSGDYKVHKTDNLHEATFLKLDINKALTLLNWKPVYDTREAVKVTVSWYKNFNQNTVNMKNLSLEQINNYVLKAREIGVGWLE